ncbi:MAG: hypothetical protein KJ063_02425 [Anaerolineae bacterium]|nr:hypothetical protein [Anaerolineae bacterium]
MANITVTEVGDTIPTVVAAEALGYLKANTVMSRLVARDWDNEVAQYGNAVKIGYPGALQANDKTANAPITLQAPNDGVYTVTLNKHKEVSFIIEDPAKWFARPDWQAAYINKAMAVVAEAVDADLLALYSGFSQTIDASGGLAEANFRLARRYLNTARAPMGQRYAVLHEDAEYEALGIERIVNRDYAESLGNLAANNFVGRFAGFDIFMDQQVVTATTQKNLFFHRNALVLASRPMAPAPGNMGVLQAVMNEDGLGLRVTMSYDHNYLGVKVTIDFLYGVAELRDNHGVVVSTQDL